MITTGLALLLTLTAVSSTPGRYAEAAEVYRCGFEPSNDINYDAWPDHWTRKTGTGYPKYLPIEIVPVYPEPSPTSGNTAATPPDSAAEGEQYLRLALDGGAASINSPKIPISPHFSYVLEAQLRTSGLKGHALTCSLTLVDGQGNVLEHFDSPRQRNLKDWTKIVVGPIEPRSDKVRNAIVGIHLEPGQQSDLFGEAWVDDIWLGRLPRMSLSSNSPHKLFTNPKDIEITCHISGIREENPQVQFELIDVNGQVLASTEQQFNGSVNAVQPNSLSEPKLSPDVADPRNSMSFAGTSTWQPPIDENGYYLIRATMSVGKGVVHRRSLALAVIADMPESRRGEFGWSLPQGEHPLQFGPLAEVLALAGVNWIKYPVWRGEELDQWGDRFARFSEQMSAHDIRVVGLLDMPPASTRHLFSSEDSNNLVAATVFHESELWMPLLDPVMTRLGLNIRWWQIGADHDTSFVGYAQLTEKMEEIKRHLERFGQEVSLGVNWRWLDQPPELAAKVRSPWAFLSHTHSRGAETGEPYPAFTGDELLRELQSREKAPYASWIILEPLSRYEYSTETRALDLVERMIAAKIARADAVFVPDPFDAEHGLMAVDGSPGELLLPWRTTSLTLAGTQFAGSIDLPSGSENRVFLNDDHAVMVAWSATPRTETLYLGENVQQIDLWGRVTQPEVIIDSQGRKQHRIEVNRLPVFITGLQPNVARWRMAFQFTQAALPSVFGRPLPVGYKYVNTFSQGVGGRIKIVTPSAWNADNDEMGFKLAPQEERRDKFYAAFGLDANSGPVPVRVDFEVNADRVYHFSVYRSQNVGLGEVEIELSSRLDEAGNLVVEQVFTNHNDEFVSFNCILFAPGRRRDRLPVFDLHRGQRKSVFILANGKELVGKTLYLRAEEIDGDRVLSYRFQAHP